MSSTLISRSLLAVLGLVSLAPVVLAKQSNSSSVEGLIRSWSRGAQTFQVTDEGRTYLVRTTNRTVFVAEHRDARLSAAQFWSSNRTGQKVDVIPAQKLNNGTIVALQVRLDD